MNYATGHETISIKNKSNAIVSFNLRSVTELSASIVSNFANSVGFRTIYKGEIFNSYQDDNTPNSASSMGHAEGIGTYAGIRAHAEGAFTKARGEISHAEGYMTLTNNDVCHAEGNYTSAIGIYSHVEGSYALASGKCSHAEGSGTTTKYWCSHAEGLATKAFGNVSHAEGRKTTAWGDNSHAEGINTYTYGDASHVEGINTYTYGDASHAEGSGTSANGIGSHAEGYRTIAIGDCSHVEGSGTSAVGFGSHAEGCRTIASGNYSHSEGYHTSAIGIYSCAIGFGNKAYDYGFACGLNNIAISGDSGLNTSSPPNEEIIRKQTIFSIGIGPHVTRKKNALEIKANGDAYFIGMGNYDGTNSPGNSAYTSDVLPLQKLMQMALQ